jgi:hypothetical protein
MSGFAAANSSCNSEHEQPLICLSSDNGWNIMVLFEAAIEKEQSWQKHIT